MPFAYKFRVLSCSLLGLAGSATAPFALAQQLPDAGSQLRQIAPPPLPARPAPEFRIQSPDAPAASDSSEAIRVTALRTEGATLFTETELLAVSGFQAGETYTLARLQALAARITDFYRGKGYFVARAYLPAQDVRDGLVTIAVTEGRYGRIEQRNSSRLSPAVAERLMGDVAAGQTVHSAPLEGSLLMLSDLPGVKVQSTLAPGVAVGTSDLFVDIVPGQAISGSIDADNQGNRYTGRERVGAVLNVNNPAGLGDVASVRLLTSGDGLKYARGAYQIQAGRGKVGISYAQLEYKLGKEFASLQANGTAKVASVFGSYPLQRSRNANTWLQLSLDDKQFDDRVDSTGSQTEKHSQLLTLNLNGDRRDLLAAGSISTFQVSAAVGNYDPKTASLRAVDAATARAEGRFAKLGFNLAHLQALTRDTYLSAAVAGQAASRNLDASEKMALGGAYGVRAYPEGETQSDQAYVLTLEARHTLNRWADTVPGQLQLVGFIDTGTGQISKTPWTLADNRRTLSGAGVGVNWSLGSDFIVKAFYAHTVGAARALSAPPASSRFWLQAVKYF